MATQITCIIRDGSDPDRRTDSVGGSGWTKSEDAVIQEIDSGTESYFVDVDGNEVEVEVANRKGSSTCGPMPTRRPKTTFSRSPTVENLKDRSEV